MDVNSLDAMIQLRRLAVEAAGTVLSDSLRQQDDAERELTNAERAMDEATVRATDLDADDAAVEAFAAWLPEGRRRAKTAQDALDRAAARTAQARTVLKLAKTALAALEASAGPPTGEPPDAPSRHGGRAGCTAPGKMLATY